MEDPCPTSHRESPVPRSFPTGHSRKNEWTRKTRRLRTISLAAIRRADNCPDWAGSPCVIFAGFIVAISLVEPRDLAPPVGEELVEVDVEPWEVRRGRPSVE